MIGYVLGGVSESGIHSFCTVTLALSSLEFSNLEEIWSLLFDVQEQFRLGQFHF